MRLPNDLDLRAPLPLQYMSLDQVTIDVEREIRVSLVKPSRVLYPVTLAMLLLYHGVVSIGIFVEVAERSGLMQGHDKALDVGEVPAEEWDTFDGLVRQKL